MKKSLIVLIIVSILSGCAGRTPRPINVMNPDDNAKSCEVLKTEIMMATNEVSRLSIEGDKTAHNVGWGIAGLFLWPLLLFMDLKNAEKHEAEAYRQRLNHLNMIYVSKKCS